MRRCPDFSSSAASVPPRFMGFCFPIPAITRDFGDYGDFF
jgi:hypothetical protein